MLPPPPVLPPGIGVTAANAAHRAPHALSLEEEVRAAGQAALGRGTRPASATHPAAVPRRGGSPEPSPAPQREYASERSRAALVREDGDREYASERSRAADLAFKAVVNAAAKAVAAHPPHMRAPAQPHSAASLDPPRRVPAGGTSIDREYASERSRNALAKEGVGRETRREPASQRSRGADLRTGAAASDRALDRRTNGRSDGGSSLDARASKERVHGGRSDASAGPVKPPSKRSAEVRESGRDSADGERHSEKKRSGWGSWIRERLGRSGGDGAVPAAADRPEQGSSDRRSSGSSGRQALDKGHAGVDHEPRSAERQSTDGRRSSGEAAGRRNSGAGSSQRGTSVAADPFTVQEWWYTDPKVGGGVTYTLHAANLV